LQAVRQAQARDLRGPPVAAAQKTPRKPALIAHTALLAKPAEARKQVSTPAADMITRRREAASASHPVPAVTVITRNHV